MLWTSPSCNGRHVTRYTLAGHPYLTWESHIPRINEQYSDSTVYLYASEADAAAGARTGGSGFIVSVPCEKIPDHIFTYCVTNAHVIESGGLTIRLNRRGGGMVVLDTMEQEWSLHPDRDDLAIRAMPAFDPTIFPTRSVQRSRFMTKELADEVNVGAGDEVFFPGRFINSEGRQKNTPAIRFGNISQMWPEPIEQQRNWGKHLQESILVEGRSISGYSGSPVFTILSRIYNRQGKPDLQADILNLIGIVWGYITSDQPIRDAAGRETGNRVIMNTGMMGVVPVWKLEELLDLPAEKAKRDEIEEREIKARAANPSVSELSAAPAMEVPIEQEFDNPFHKEDFTSLLGRAATTKPEADQT